MTFEIEKLGLSRIQDPSYRPDISPSDSVELLALLDQYSEFQFEGIASGDE
jgi:hypothetical protein